MSVNFNNLTWHDAELKSVFINRSEAGKNDEIKVVVRFLMIQKIL